MVKIIFIKFVILLPHSLIGTDAVDDDDEVE